MKASDSPRDTACTSLDFCNSLHKWNQLPPFHVDGGTIFVLAGQPLVPTRGLALLTKVEPVGSNPARIGVNNNSWSPAKMQGWSR